MATSRPVLMPGGWPPDERERDACARVLLCCKVDFSSVLDTPARDVDAYAERIARIPFVQSPDALPLFFITGRLTSPEPLLVLHSRVLERARVLAHSSWVVCLAPASLSDFIREAAVRADIEPVGRGLCAWKTAPRPMLVASWAAAENDIASASTTLGLVPESGFIATVASDDSAPGVEPEGAVVSLESLGRMRAAQERHASPEPSGSVGLRPNPRLRRNG